MFHTTMTPGLLGAELDYRRERLAADVSSSRRLVTWVGRLRRSSSTGPDELTLAA